VSFVVDELQNAGTTKDTKVHTRRGRNSTGPCPGVPLDIQT
jgi:hypothetical protein